MSRSGYSMDGDGEYLELYRANVDRAISGKRGQKFLKDLATAMDTMPQKRLIDGKLQDQQGEVCAIGAYCKFKQIDVTDVDYYDATEVSELVNIAELMAREVVFENDEAYNWASEYQQDFRPETPEERWVRIREWVRKNIA